MKVETAAYKRSRQPAASRSRGVGAQQAQVVGPPTHPGGIIISNAPPPELATLTPQPPPAPSYYSANPALPNPPAWTPTATTATASYIESQPQLLGLLTLINQPLLSRLKRTPLKDCETGSNL